MKRRSGWAVMSRLIVLVKPLTGRMILAVLMGLLGHLCAVFISLAAVYALLGVLGFSVQVSRGVLFAGMILLAILRAGLRYGEQASNHYIAFKLLALIRDKVFRALRSLCPAKLDGKNRGDLISLITSDIELLEVFYAHTISPVLIAVSFSAIMCLYIGRLHWSLGLLALAAYGTVGVVMPLITNRIGADAGMCYRTASGALSGFVLDSLRGLPEIQQYGQGERRAKEMERRTDELCSCEERMKAVAGRNGAFVNVLILLFDLAMLLTAVSLCASGKLSGSGVLLATVAMMSSFGPVVALANLGATLQSTLAAGRRVLDILDETPEVQEIVGRDRILFHGASVQNVGFSYGGEPVLEDVSLEFPKRRIIGIVGRSGSGKSTLLKLLMRFWQAQEGRVCISGRSVEEINTVNLREMESSMTQQTHLFHDSIRNNLQIARLGATQEELEAACRKASIHDFIMTLPKGYDTPVGELGDTLSGGERQRLGLARAFLHDAPLMLLDEPTSNLDSLNEAVILRALKEEASDKTVVLVSHRASTVRIADQVYRVDRGRLS